MMSQNCLTTCKDRMCVYPPGFFPPTLSVCFVFLPHPATTAASANPKTAADEVVSTHLNWYTTPTHTSEANGGVHLFVGTYKCQLQPTPLASAPSVEEILSSSSKQTQPETSIIMPWDHRVRFFLSSTHASRHNQSSLDSMRKAIFRDPPPPTGRKKKKRKEKRRRRWKGNLCRWEPKISRGEPNTCTIFEVIEPKRELVR